MGIIFQPRTALLSLILPRRRHSRQHCNVSSQLPLTSSFTKSIHNSYKMNSIGSTFNPDASGTAPKQTENLPSLTMRDGKTIPMV